MPGTPRPRRATPPPPPPAERLPSWVRALPDADAVETSRLRTLLHRARRPLLAAGGLLVLGAAGWWAWPAGGKARPPATERAAATGPAAAPGESFEQARAEARRLFQQGRFAEAGAAYQRAVKLDPGQAGAFAGLGAALGKIGDRAGALAAYRQAVRLQPDHAGFRAALGRVYRDSGQAQQARQQYQKSVELDPGNQAAQQALKELASR